MINYLSIDFESWAYPNLPAFKSLTSKERKSLDAGFVKESAEKILKILDKYKVKLTFFVLGELYEWYPEVMSWIAKEGHEIAYHTHRHEVLRSEEGLVDSLKNSKKFLDNFKPKGFRAPEILMQKRYLKILKSYGFSYDSSIYGPYSLKREIDGILEIPVSTYPIFSRFSRWRFPRSISAQAFFTEPPIGSGFLIAILGKKIGWFFRRLNKKRQPVIAFMHNWQITKPEEATFPLGSYLLTHPGYLPYIRDCCKIFEYLLANFEFGKMEDLLKQT